MNRLIHVETDVVNEMKAAAEQNANECCGFFFGHEDHTKRMITKSLAVVNSKKGDQTGNFEISSDAYIHAERLAEQHQLTLLGVYHSHPNFPAIPSLYDREVALPFFSYIILSVNNQKCSSIRSWRLNNRNQFREETLT